MKSGAWQDSIILAATFVSAASRLCRTSLRPRIPPAALHHPTKASAESNNSWLRPGTAVLPGSDMVATLIVVSVTPGSVAPFAVPAPQTAFNVPKSPGAAASVVEDADGVDVLLLL